MLYEALNLPVVMRIPRTTTRLLDIGCGTGSLGRQIKQDIHCEVVGITSSAVEAELAAQNINRVVLEDLNTYDFNGLGSFDCIICSHILEHLYQPQMLLERLRDHLLSGGILIVALPNVLFWKQRLQFVMGRFRYAEGGLMDNSHIRFFDWVTAQELLRQSGYRIAECFAAGGFPLPGIRHILPRQCSPWLDKTAARLSPGLFGFQFVFSCYQESTKAPILKSL